MFEYVKSNAGTLKEGRDLLSILSGVLTALKFRKNSVQGSVKLRNLPLGRENFRDYLLDKKLFPIGFESRADEFLSRIEHEHENRGGLHCKVRYPINSITTVLTELRELGHYENRRPNSWRRIAAPDKDAEHDANST
ncbi:MAG: hypothetical protein F4227_01490 [Gammaproteobacteria bacterium]|nr:hypothetical protein [Gammaproteobacteria bacterium]MYF01677.1 hypothetical protein [Gammaproteobacteria bacterium]MYI76808.1 hypothetical protein [Gammaproteobacteria bacterium]